MKTTSQSESILSLYEELASVKKTVDKLYHKALKVLPAKEGSDLWWKKENELSMEEYGQGKYTQYPSIDAFVKAMEKDLE